MEELSVRHVCAICGETVCNIDVEDWPEKFCWEFCPSLLMGSGVHSFGECLMQISESREFQESFGEFAYRAAANLPIRVVQQFADAQVGLHDVYTYALGVATPYWAKREDDIYDVDS